MSGIDIEGAVEKKNEKEESEESYLVIPDDALRDLYNEMSLASKKHLIENINKDNDFTAELSQEFVKKKYNIEGRLMTPLAYCISRNEDASHEHYIDSILTFSQNLDGMLSYAVCKEQYGIAEKILNALIEQEKKQMPDASEQHLEIPSENSDGGPDIEIIADEIVADESNEQPSGTVEFTVSQQQIDFFISRTINTPYEKLTAVDYAIMNGEPDFLEKLIAAGAKLDDVIHGFAINGGDIEDMLPIQLAVSQEIEPGVDKKKNRIKVLELLLAQSPESTARATLYGKNKLGLISLAAFFNNTHYLRALLKKEDLLTKDDLELALNCFCQYINKDNSSAAVIGAILLLAQGEGKINDQTLDIHPKSKKILARNRDQLIKGLDNLLEYERYDDIICFLRAIKNNSSLKEIIYPLKNENELTQFVITIVERKLTTNSQESNTVDISPEEENFASFVNRHRSMTATDRLKRFFVSEMKKLIISGRITTVKGVDNYVLRNSKTKSAQFWSDISKKRDDTDSDRKSEFNLSEW